MTMLKNGIIEHCKIELKRFTGIEKGMLVAVNALVIHQTGVASAQSTFNSYKAGGNGRIF